MVEPQLIAHMQEYRDKLKEVIDEDLEKVLSSNYEFINRVNKFVPHKTSINSILDDELFKKITS